MKDSYRPDKRRQKELPQRDSGHTSSGYQGSDKRKVIDVQERKKEFFGKIDSNLKAYDKAKESYNTYLNGLKEIMQLMKLDDYKKLSDTMEDIVEKIKGSDHSQLTEERVRMAYKYRNEAYKVIIDCLDVKDSVIKHYINMRDFNNKARGHANYIHTKYAFFGKEEISKKEAFENKINANRRTLYQYRINYEGEVDATGNVVSKGIKKELEENKNAIFMFPEDRKLIENWLDDQHKKKSNPAH